MRVDRLAVVGEESETMGPEAASSDEGNWRELWRTKKLWSWSLETKWSFGCPLAYEFKRRAGCRKERWR